MTFGIPRHVLPFDRDYKLVRKEHLKWTRKLESNHEDISIIPQNVVELTPGPGDIIMGRGQRGIRSAGNLKLKRLLLERRSEYESAPRFEKSATVEAIFKEMMACNHRFLIPTQNNGWEEADATAIKAKIAHGFRNLRLSSRPKAN